MTVDDILFCIDHYRATHGKPATKITAGARARRAMLLLLVDDARIPVDAPVGTESFMFAGLRVEYRNMHGIELS